MRRRLASILLGVLLLGTFAAPVSGAAPVGQWHRLNPYNTLPEHERLRCLETHALWACFYDKVPEGDYQWNATIGTFVGRAITRTWTCPEWFPNDICDNVVAVYSGLARYYPPGGTPFTVDEQYVITERDGQPFLAQYWVEDQFVCPWFRTWSAAQEALPDCTQAPDS